MQKREPKRGGKNLPEFDSVLDEASTDVVVVIVGGSAVDDDDDGDDDDKSKGTADMVVEDGSVDVVVSVAVAVEDDVDVDDADESVVISNGVIELALFAERSIVVVSIALASTSI